MWQKQGCQIFLETIYQNGGKYTKLSKLPNGYTMYQMAVVYSKCPTNIITFSISRSSKNYQNWDFWVWKYTIWQPWTEVRLGPPTLGPQECTAQKLSAISFSNWNQFLSSVFFFSKLHAPWFTIQRCHLSTGAKFNQIDPPRMTKLFLLLTFFFWSASRCEKLWRKKVAPDDQKTFII
jgi:hypothetical protein